MALRADRMELGVFTTHRLPQEKLPQPLPPFISLSLSAGARAGEEDSNPLQYSQPGESRGPEDLAGCIQSAGLQSRTPPSKTPLGTCSCLSVPRVPVFSVTITQVTGDS